MNANRGDFRFEKWYFDCVTPEGVVLIGYAARLAWGPFRLNYGARLIKTAAAPLSQRQSFAFGTVHAAGGTITWDNPALNVGGAWIGGEPIARTVVLDDPAGRIVWQCLGANSAVHSYADGQAISGTGYVERLTMTIPPWKFPFHELRWGRFISDDRYRSMVWIDLRGGQQRNWVWIDAAQPVTGNINAAGVQTDRAELIFLDGGTVRQENVAQTVLGPFQFLKGLLTRKLSAIQEDKQLSTCLLKLPAGEAQGVSIHEVVKWG